MSTDQGKPSKSHADIMVKAAEYIQVLEEEHERLKKKLHENKTASVEEEATELAEKIQRATGTEVEPSLAKKIASYEDEDVKQLINKIASTEEVDSLGTARRKGPSEKTAHDKNDVEKAEEEFAQWILNG